MISVRHLSKSYNSNVAVSDISFDIRQGECFGLLGPNGAGKTTTLSILSTLIPADAGSVSVAGFDIKTQAPECKKSIGVVPQEIALYEELTAWQNLLFWGGLYGVSGKKLRDRAEEILTLVGLSDRRHDKVKTYSGGMKRRINIAAALLHHPHILFMDEPTVGIDPQSRNLIFEVVEKFHKEGMTLIYTTHYMEEAERLCDRIGIIESGKLIACGTIDELKALSPVKESIDIQLTNLTGAELDHLKLEFPSLIYAGQLITLPSHSVKTDLGKLVLKCSELGLDIIQVEIKKINLESVFLALTGKQLRD
ncbi:MAG: ABC transporter ATP-binding protein [Bacteroidia bacterium]|nr:ABC transporter ATP-binding protein [Bacteroidia bacterium]